MKTNTHVTVNNICLLTTICFLCWLLHSYWPMVLILGFCTFTGTSKSKDNGDGDGDGE